MKTRNSPRPARHRQPGQLERLPARSHPASTPAARAAQLLSRNNAEVRGFSEVTEWLQVSNLGMSFSCYSWASYRGHHPHPHTVGPLAWGQHHINPTASAAPPKLSPSLFRQNRLLYFLASLFDCEALGTAHGQYFSAESRGMACRGQSCNTVAVAGEDM